MVLDGTVDEIEAPPVTGNHGVDPDGDGIANEMPGEPGGLHGVLPAQLLQARRQRIAERVREVNSGRTIFTSIGCASCHIADPDDQRTIAGWPTSRRSSPTSTRRARRPAATRSTGCSRRRRPDRHRSTIRLGAGPQAAGAPVVRRQQLLRGPEAPRSGQQLPRAQLRRHVPAAVHDRAAVGRRRRRRPTGTTAAAQTLEEVILRHGGEAQAARDGFNGAVAAPTRTWCWRS